MIKIISTITIPGQLNKTMMSGLFLGEYDDDIQQEQKKLDTDIGNGIRMYAAALHQAWMDTDSQG